MSDKTFDNLMAQLQGWITKAQQPGPAEQQFNADYSNIQNFLNGHDYRTPATGITLDILPKSAYDAQRVSLRGPMSNDPILQRQQALSDAQFDQSYGNAYENQIGGLLPRQLGLTSSLQSLYDNRGQMGLQGYMDALSGLRNKPQGFDWAGLLGKAANVGIGLATGGLGSAGLSAGSGALGKGAAGLV